MKGDVYGDSPTTVLSTLVLQSVLHIHYFPSPLLPPFFPSFLVSLFNFASLIIP